MQEINIDSLSAEQIEALQAQLLKKQEKERALKEKTKRAYEAKRDKNIKSIVTQAINLHEKMLAFKTYISELMEEQHLALLEYREIRANSKGGFSITNQEGNLRVTRTRDTEPFWDERGTKAVAILKGFLEEMGRKRDAGLVKVLLGFLAKNDKGDLEYSRVFQLMKERNTFDDPRWHEGLDLLLESYQVMLRGYGYEIKIRDGEGKWKNVSLNFTGL